MYPCKGAILGKNNILSYRNTSGKNKGKKKCLKYFLKWYPTKQQTVFCLILCAKGHKGPQGSKRYEQRYGPVNISHFAIYSMLSTQTLQTAKPILRLMCLFKCCMYLHMVRKMFKKIKIYIPQIKKKQTKKTNSTTLQEFKSLNQFRIRFSNA